MRKTTFESKLVGLLDPKQFSEKRAMFNSIVLKVEKVINKELLAMPKKDKISEILYNKLRSKGEQSAQLYGLAKVHKVDTPFIPLLSLPGSSHDKLNKTVAKF